MLRRDDAEDAISSLEYAEGLMGVPELCEHGVVNGAALCYATHKAPWEMCRACHASYHAEEAIRLLRELFYPEPDPTEQDEDRTP